MSNAIVAGIPPLPSIPGVEIRHIDGFPGYAVSDDGRVFSCRRCGRISGFGQRWYVLRPGIHAYGHCQVVLYREHGDKTQRRVHSLVLSTFVGPCPPGMEACHYPDRNPGNNRLDNLRWDTTAANMNDRRLHQSYCGEDVWTAKLTAQDVITIRQRYADGETQTSLAKEYGVAQPTVSAIVLRKTWIHC